MTKLNKEYLEQFLDDETVEELVQESGVGDFLDPTVVKFANSFQLKSGTIRVPTFIIYMMYRSSFTRVQNSDKVKPVAFFRTFKKLFVQKRSGKQRFYLLDTDFDLEPEVWGRHQRQYGIWYGRKK